MMDDNSFTATFAINFAAVSRYSMKRTLSKT